MVTNNQSDLTLVDVYKLQQKNTINLLRVELTTGEIICVCDSFDFNYLGVEYDYLDFSISGDLETQTDERSRPTVRLANPNSMFHKLAVSGTLEGALVTRQQLETTYEDQTQVSTARLDVWKVYQIPNISTDVTLQLRRLGDSPTLTLPPRAYYPPDFNHVSV